MIAPRRLIAMEWGVLAKRSMSPRFIIIARIGLQVPAQVCLAQYDQMVERIHDGSTRSSVRQRRSTKGGLGAMSLSRMPMARDRRGTAGAIDPVLVEATQSLIPRGKSQ
jgi:hypothetical protein